MTEYRFTIGVQYAREPHPSMPHATPNGWLAVHASSRDEARALAGAVLGREWAFDYGPDAWENAIGIGGFAQSWDELYPAGPFHTITSEPATVTTTDTCRHCGHGITFKLDTWIAPDAGTDVENGDGIWRESCPDNHGSFTALHEPVT